MVLYISEQASFGLFAGAGELCGSSYKCNRVILRALEGLESSLASYFGSGVLKGWKALV